MIKSITTLQNFGIFADYAKPKELEEFAKYNLIYGWNGSGKSTLSKVFECVSKGHIIADFPDATLKMDTDIGIIDNKNLTKQDLDICVFNSNFVKENINWDSLVRSILLISKEKIEEKKIWKEKKDTHKTKSDLLEEKTREKQTLDDNAQKLLSGIAKNIKNRFQILDSTDSYFVNYNRSKVQSKITTHSSEIESGSLLLQTEILEKTQQAVSPKFKNSVQHSISPINQENFTQTAQRLNSLFKETATSTSIDHLLENPHIQSWIETGLEIHTNNTTCEFCGHSISIERLKTLNDHFSESFKIFKTRLNSATQWIQSNIISNPPRISIADLYEEFATDIPKLEDEVEEAITSLNQCLQEWQIVLDKKIDNPFDTQLVIETPSSSIFETLNISASAINKKITAHNDKAENFNTEIASAKTALELHFLSEEIRDSEFKKIEDSSKSLLNPIAELGKEIQTLNSEINELEKQLNNESIGAENFNDALHRFLGRDSISLRFDTTQKGYKILRIPENLPARNLSEGEKNAIGLIYFLTKLSENERDIKNSIVVFDDPVSSFDSNNLFNAHSFLRDRCQDAKQLFLLTHSFNYFKLARDWLGGKNKKTDAAHLPIIKSRFYSIDASLTAPRVASLKNAPSSLTNFNSEYHFLYSTLRQHLETQTLSMEVSFSVANMSRKLLEAFLTFKFPHGRGDFRNLMDQAITEPAKCERIYRFINKYSHNQVIEFDDSAADNIAAESEYIVRDIFEEIKKLDATHYAGMEKALATQTA
jgi:wobble nucleotide-excising tRNase